MGIFSFFRKRRKNEAMHWMGTGWNILEEGYYEGAIIAFNKVHKIYKIEDLKPYKLSPDDLDDYVSILFPSYLGLAVAYSGDNKLDLAIEKLSIVKFFASFYQLGNPKDMMLKLGYGSLIKLLERIEKHTL